MIGDHPGVNPVTLVKKVPCPLPSPGSETSCPEDDDDVGRLTTLDGSGRVVKMSETTGGQGE